jgi:chromosome segregation ATPase
MTDEELVKRLRWMGHENTDAGADRIEALTAERDEHWKSFVHWRKEADDLTEQLEAARADAKEAEAYAEELQGDLTELCRQLIAAEDKLATCEKYRDAYAECDRIGTQAVRDLEAKLAKAVEALDDLLEAITAEDRFGDRSLTITGPTANLKWLLETEEEARATLAEIDGEKE